MNEPLNDFEIELIDNLRRIHPPPSFAGTVMDRIAAESRPVLSFPQRHPWAGRVAALFLLAALLFGAGTASIRHHRAVERAQAQRDFARSQELTSRALEPVRRHLRQAGVFVDE